MRVLDVGNLNLKMRSKTDFHVKLRGVYVTEGIGLNLFALRDAQARQKKLSTRMASIFFMVV